MVLASTENCSEGNGISPSGFLVVGRVLEGGVSGLGGANRTDTARDGTWKKDRIENTGYVLLALLGTEVRKAGWLGLSGGTRIELASHQRHVDGSRGCEWGMEDWDMRNGREIMVNIDGATWSIDVCAEWLGIRRPQVRVSGKEESWFMGRDLIDADAASW